MLFLSFVEEPHDRLILLLDLLLFLLSILVDLRPVIPGVSSRIGPYERTNPIPIQGTP